MPQDTVLQTVQAKDQPRGLKMKLGKKGIGCQIFNPDLYGFRDRNNKGQYLLVSIY